MHGTGPTGYGCASLDKAVPRPIPLPGRLMAPLFNKAFKSTAWFPQPTTTGCSLVWVVLDMVENSVSLPMWFYWGLMKAQFKSRSVAKTAKSPIALIL